jgi:hypothetical protein
LREYDIKNKTKYAEKFEGRVDVGVSEVLDYLVKYSIPFSYLCINSQRWERFYEHYRQGINIVVSMNKGHALYKENGEAPMNNGT